MIFLINVTGENSWVKAMSMNGYNHNVYVLPIKRVHTGASKCCKEYVPNNG